MTTNNQKKHWGATRDALDVIEELSGPFSFAKFVRTERRRMELTQVELAKKLGITKGTLCDIEKGRQLVSVSLARKIAKKCGNLELLAIEACLQDQLRKAKVNMKVKLIA